MWKITFNHLGINVQAFVQAHSEEEACNRFAELAPDLADRLIAVEPYLLEKHMGDSGLKEEGRLSFETLFRKKPVTVEAFQWTGGRDQEDDPIWIKEAINIGKVRFEQGFKGDTFIPSPRGDAVAMVIKTLEGDMLAFPEDFIIRGVEGEIYPCKPAIFEKTYEPIKEEK